MSSRKRKQSESSTAMSTAPREKNKYSVFSGSEIWQQCISSFKLEEDPQWEAYLAAGKSYI
jgi:hypothetical protein